LGTHVSTPLHIIDLFCGCGGFSLGAHSAGLAPSLAFDIDPILTSSFSVNFPKTRLSLADLSYVNGLDIKRLAGGNVFGVFGGPPCQGFSDIGKRKPDDPRRTLLGHFFRLIAELQPAFFVMENVRGLGYADARPVLVDALNLLPSYYEILGPIILDAADFGAATRRPRLFVIGYDRAYVDRFSVEDLTLRQRPPATVRAAIADIASAKHVTEVDGYDIWKIVRRGRSSNYASGLLAPDLTFTGNRKTAHTPAVVARFERLPQGGVDQIGRHPRLTWNGQCPTLRAGTGNDRGSYQSVRPIHPDEPRVITVREAARLQGFPDTFRFHPTVWHSFRMIGNSVSPVVSKAIFETIACRTESIKKIPTAPEITHCLTG
jgi:DNA (cytosine-5)-methyltransferase 1